MLNENKVVELVTSFLLNKDNWNRHEDKTKISSLHEHWVDIKLIWWKRNSEYFLIECKWKSYAKSAKSVNKEWWLNALWQIITRMDTCRIIKTWKSKWDINRAYKYWLWLYWEAAQVAIRRIPKEVAQVLNLYIFSVNDAWKVIQFTPSQLGKKYEDEYFK
jgi:hypothetical protein